jgi:cyclohexyl-isocyanide hydratase
VKIGIFAKRFSSTTERRRYKEPPIVMTFQVVIPIFPRVTQLDFAAPAQFFAYVPNTKVHLAGFSRGPIETDSGFSVCASTTFIDCPAADLVCIPGGPGVFDALADTRLLDFVRHQVSVARYVTSVCTGMFLLGAIGALRGKRVTSHWGYTGAIEKCGAVHAPGRVVTDGNIITAGGVTAGLDYAMVAIAEVFGDETAKTVQLRMEYDPAPPFDSGHPSRASDRTLAAVSEFYATATQRMRDALGACT